MPLDFFASAKNASFILFASAVVILCAQKIISLRNHFFSTTGLWTLVWTWSISCSKPRSVVSRRRKKCTGGFRCLKQCLEVVSHFYQSEKIILQLCLKWPIQCQPSAIANMFFMSLSLFLPSSCLRGTRYDQRHNNTPEIFYPKSLRISTKLGFVLTIVILLK